MTAPLKRLTALLFRNGMPTIDHVRTLLAPTALRHDRPDICAHCKGWHYNDGDGLDAAGAVALAEALQSEIDDGRTETYARRAASYQEMMPDEPCETCGGTGVRKPPPEPKPNADPNDPFPDLVQEFDPRKHSGADDLKEGGIKCNGCQGSGFVRPWASQYPFSTENVTDFVAFLRESVGFEIWRRSAALGARKA